MLLPMKHSSHRANDPPDMQCQRNGHMLRSTFMPGERLCTRCGKKVHCPSCTSHVPQGAFLVYCLQHDPVEIAFQQTERSVQA